MNLQSPDEKDWTSTCLKLSEGPQLFDNPGIARLRRAVEIDFVTRHLAGRKIAKPVAGICDTWDAVCAFAALPAQGGLAQLLDVCAMGLRAGGRLVVDLRSPIHWQAAFGHALADWPERSRDDPAVAMCSIDTLLAAADARGLTLMALEPYGGLWDNAQLYLRLRRQFKWLRLLSWLDSDEAFFKLALLMEQRVVAKLGTSSSGRYMVALEKRADPTCNAAWASRLEGREAILATSSLTGLESLLCQRPENTAIAIAALAGSLHSQNLLFVLQQALAFHRPGFALEPWLAPQVVEQLRKWHHAETIDARSMGIVRGWVVEPEKRLRKGVDLVSGLEYHLASSLSRNYFKIYSGVSS